MARKKADLGAANKTSLDPFTPAKIHSTTKLPTQSIPTGNRKHTVAIREGRQSSEIWCRKPERRRELGLPPIPTVESDFIDELRK